MTMTDARGAALSEMALSELDFVEPDAFEVAVEALVVDDAVEALVVDVEPAPVPTAPDGDRAPRRERHLRVAPDSVARRRHVRIAAAAAAISISATLFAVVGFNVELAQHQIQLQSLQHKLQAEQTQYYELRDEVAQRSSPAQIVHEATTRGLVLAPLTYLGVPGITPPKDPAGTNDGPNPSFYKQRGSLEPGQ
jgi:cell division protein FtsL